MSGHSEYFGNIYVPNLGKNIDENHIMSEIMKTVIMKKCQRSLN